MTVTDVIPDAGAGALDRPDLAIAILTGANALVTRVAYRWVIQK